MDGDQSDQSDGETKEVRECNVWNVIWGNNVILLGNTYITESTFPLNGMFLV